MTHDIQRVLIAGAGTMGHGIAQVAAMSGCDVALFDIGDDLVQRGVDKIRANLEKGVERGKLNVADKDATLARIRGTTELAAAAKGVDLFIEAVPERIDLKADVMKIVAAHAGDQVILGSNTSSLSLTELAARSPLPGRVIGLHFFNPVHIMKLLEIVTALQTDDDVLQTCLAFSTRLGKEPIVVKDSPGFATSRLGLVIGLEAMRMLEAGVATAQDIDKAMELGYAHPMGPLRLTDLVGLDVRLAIADYLHKELGEQFRAPPILRRLVRAGHLGKKTGQGFYRW